MKGREGDERVRRTRGAILESFHRLVLGRPYGRIQVGDIVEGAGVGRSTFYEHFRGKDALLESSFAGILGVLADAATEAADEARIAHVLEHFRENRKLARPHFTGETGAQVARLLADHVAARLADADGGSRRLLVPTHLAAAQVAGMQVALVHEWLRDPRACPADELARAFVRATRGMLGGLAVRR